MMDFLPHKKKIQAFADVRNDLANSLFAVLGWVTLPGIAVSLSRALEVGWTADMGFQLAVVAAVWLIVLFRKKLPYQLKITLFVLYWLLQGILGILSYGLSGGGLGFLLTLVIILSLMVSYRTSLVVLGFVILFLGGVMLSLQMGWLTFTRDFTAYNNSLTSWVGAVIFILFWSGSVLVVAYRLQSLLEQAKTDASAHSLALEELNQRLEREVEKSRLSEEKFKIIMDQVPDIISLLDEKGQLLFNSSASFRIHGWTTEDLQGRDTFELIHPEDREHVGKIMAKVMESKDQEATARYRYLNKDGSYTWMEASARNELQKSGIQALVTISRDITTQKQNEHEREKLILELERKNLELEKFIYSVSHDLKSPLITVLGFLGYAKRSLETGNIQRATQDLNRIGGAIGKIDELLENLLELSSVGTIQNNPMEFQMGTALREALVLIDADIKAAGVTVSIPNDFPTLRGDLVRVVKIWEHLLENGIKFRAPGRPIELEAGWRNTPTGAEYFLRDNGLGIPKGYQEKVFRLFEKVDARTSGTGLGLALVKKIAEVHGGQSWIVSEEGAGTTVFFTLGDRIN